MTKVVIQDGDNGITWNEWDEEVKKIVDWLTKPLPTQESQERDDTLTRINLIQLNFELLGRNLLGPRGRKI